MCITAMICITKKINVGVAVIKYMYNETSFIVQMFFFILFQSSIPLSPEKNLSNFTVHISYL